MPTSKECSNLEDFYKPPDNRIYVFIAKTGKYGYYPHVRQLTKIFSIWIFCFKSDFIRYSIREPQIQREFLRVSYKNVVNKGNTISKLQDYCCSFENLSVE